MKRLALFLPVLLAPVACRTVPSASSGDGVVVLMTPPSPDSSGRLRVGDVHLVAAGSDRVAFFETVVFEDQDGDGAFDPGETAWSESTVNGPLDHDVDVRTGAAHVHPTERTRQLVRLELESGFEHVEVWRVTAEGLLPL